jgi:methylated-DNA-[protein]-cysteine S-methyltransferase
MTARSFAQWSLHSPLGDLTVTAEDDRIVSLDWGRGPPAFQGRTALLEEANRQLNAYFDGTLRRFDLPLAPAGTAFAKSVWTQMQAIPYGQTRTYGEIAAGLGASPQAIGNACGANPLPIIIPCHRVIAAGGRLGGYSGVGGTETKSRLLALEAPPLFHSAATL